MIFEGIKILKLKYISYEIFVLRSHMSRLEFLVSSSFKSGKKIRIKYSIWNFHIFPLESLIFSAFAIFMEEGTKSFFFGIFKISKLEEISDEIILRFPYMSSRVSGFPLASPVFMEEIAKCFLFEDIQIGSYMAEVILYTKILDFIFFLFYIL